MLVLNVASVVNVLVHTNHKASEALDCENIIQQEDRNHSDVRKAINHTLTERSHGIFKGKECTLHRYNTGFMDIVGTCFALFKSIDV